MGDSRPRIQSDIVIVGSGPAGMSTALHLVQAGPQWAPRIVVIEKAIHPREKLCGGGITRLGEDVLAGLGLSLEPPHVDVREARFLYRRRAYGLRGNPVFRIVRREEFDHWLVRLGQARGITVRQGETVKDVRSHTDHVEVVTDRAVFHAKTVVAADGAASVVRRKLQWGGDARLARLLEVLTPERETHPAFCGGIAVFDFSRMTAGLQGYSWQFPSRINGAPFMNRGVFDSRVRPGQPALSIRREFAAAMRQGGREPAAFRPKGFPIRWFDKEECFARPRVLLTGEAAGVDPLFGEGISFALAYGEVAAAAIVEAFARRDFSYTRYRERLLAHPVISQLDRRAKLARGLYKIHQPWLAHTCWRLAHLPVRYLAWRHPYFIPLENPRLIRIRPAN